jgi:hypothetical protein
MVAGTSPQDGGRLELSTPGTYGSIHATLAHLVRSDGWFLSGAPDVSGWAYVSS